MPGDVVLVDTGPLVALFDPSDADRDRCEQQLAELKTSDLVTTEAVITETAYLLAFSYRAQAALLRFLASGRPRVEALRREDHARSGELIEKYSDRPMDYADATIVVLAERLRTRRVFTLDLEDFRIYRANGKTFQIVPVGLGEDSE
jgi:predicted nucleic acid-binding protein